MSPFRPFPQTHGIDLVGDAAARRAVRSAAERDGVAVVLAHPFVLSRRSSARSLLPAVAAAAEIGAGAVNILAFVDEPRRLVDEVALLAEQAARAGMQAVVEVFGGSSVPTLAAADALAGQLPGGGLRLCVDHLHLVRSGGGNAVPPLFGAAVVHAQLSDGPAHPVADRDEEAMHGRLALGAGSFDVAAFIGSLPQAAPLGLEIPPPRSCRTSDEPERVRALMTATSAFLRRIAAGDAVGPGAPPLR